MPQRRHCHIKLATWRGLQRHIEHANCHQFSPDRSCQVAYVDLPNLRAHAATEAWQALTGFDGEDQGLLPTLQQSFSHG